MNRNEEHGTQKHGSGELVLNDGTRKSVSWKLEILQGRRATHGLIRGQKDHVKAAAKDGCAILYADGATLAINVYNYKNGQAAFAVLLARVPLFAAQTVSDWWFDENQFSMLLSCDDGERFRVTIPTIAMRGFLALAPRQLESIFVANASPSRFVKIVAITGRDGHCVVSVALDNGDSLDLPPDDAREMGKDLIALANQIDKRPLAA